MRLFRGTGTIADAASALPGRAREVEVPPRHAVLDSPLKRPFPAGVETGVFGMGCFWGAERLFWEAEGVYTTAVGYAGGFTPNPTYEEVCSGRTGHAEVVLVAFDASRTSYEAMLKLFWEGHDPTQGMRQGNDVGSQYRSLILYAGQEQHSAALASLSAYQQGLSAAGHGSITTELAPADSHTAMYYAESYHQQYLAKNPGGYDCASGLGIACPIGLNVSESTPETRSLSSNQ